MGEWLEDLKSEEKMNRVLHALYVCLMHYIALYESEKAAHRKWPVSTQDPDEAASWVLDRKVGQKGDKKK